MLPAPGSMAAALQSAWINSFARSYNIQHPPPSRTPMVLAPYVMGIDLGTTTCRCAIFDLHGTEIASAYREIPVRYPRPLWAEVDPETWWLSTVEGVREALDRSSIAPDQIAGVGLSGLMHAPVLL